MDINTIAEWFQDNSIIGIGVILTIFGLIFTISELRVYLKHQSSSDQLIFWVMVFTGGLITAIFNDIVLGFLFGISIIMIIETIKMWDAPVWGKLMASTTAAYLVILLGRMGQIIYDYVKNPENPNEQIFSAAFNVSFYVFIISAFIFFGRKFILVSRLSSPQIIYLFLFGLMYGVIVFLQDRKIALGDRSVTFFQRDEKGFTQAYNYLGISGDWPDRIMFANFGTFEALAIIMVFMYFISGWLLATLFGVKPVTDPEILRKVHEVAQTMGIDDDIKVGYLNAPILNAFAYGPWFDKRIAFISSDLKSFTDSDIRGIVGHELAHSAKNHVIFLLLLSIFELAVKKALGFPATTLDYTFLPDDAVQNISFVGYYILSYAFLVVLLIFVRTLEGHADKVTKEAGYGEDLAKALYRLEGFYNGVASDFGISVNLLTDRQYTIHEKIRFTAQAGRNLYSEVLAPSRGSALANIFQSHPRTSYRIISMVKEDFNPMKAAFFPYRLLGFGFRKRAIKELNEHYESYYKIIDQTYLEDYGVEALEEVLEYTPLLEVYNPLIGKSMLAYDRIDKKEVVGELSTVKPTNRVTSPITATVGETEFDLGRSQIKEYYPGENYFLKDGRIVELMGYTVDNKKGVLIEISHNDSTELIELSKLGKPISYIEQLQGQDVMIFDKGISKLSKVNSVNLGKSWDESKISVNGSELDGSQLIVDFPPLGVEIRKEKLEEQREFLEYLVGKKVLLYTKDNFDVSMSGTVERLEQDNLFLKDADGLQEIKLNRLEYVVYDYPTVEFVTKEHISFFTKIGIKWANRNEFNYISS